MGMDNILNIILGLACVLLCLICVLGIVVVIAAIVLYVRRLCAKRNQANESDETIDVMLRSFSDKSENSNPGRYFVKLIKAGYFVSLKTGNHGNDFPDEIQRASFIKFLKPEIIKVLDEVGDNYEKSFI
jgi:hypothetical protein